MKTSQQSAFHSAPSYFSLPPRSPSSVPSQPPISSATPSRTTSEQAWAPTAGSSGFADALAKQLNHHASGVASSSSKSTTPTGSRSQRMTLTPRKRSPPSNDETPPHQKSDFFGSSAATPYVSRLSLNAVSSVSLPDEVSLSKKSHGIATRPKSDSLPPRPFKMPAVNSSAASSKATRPVQSDRFHPLLPAELFRLLQHQSSDDEILLLDLRSHSAFSLAAAGRLAHSINLCVPSTLLRRPNYKIPKVADSVADADERLRVLHATQDAEAGLLSHLVVIDQNSSFLAADSPLHALLLKYDAEGFKGRLHWVQGGFHAISKVEGFERFCETGPRASSSRERSPSSRSSSISLHRSGSEASDSGFGSSWSTSQTSLHSDFSNKLLSQSPESVPKDPILDARSLPMAAFDGRSTQNYISGTGASSHQVGPEAKVFSNPFFDSIRQNHEALSYQRSMENLRPISYPFEEELRAKAHLFPLFLRSLILLDPRQRAERLAKEFYELEAMEQKRMQQVMDWHANVQNQTGDSYNPHSISAGVELGYLNRYKHIFPFEHSRCRLKELRAGKTDYINASHITFAGQLTTKSYIATQGPVMPACGDFHQLLMQEHIGVVLMLCNLREGGQEKCCKYWGAGVYGHMRVERSREEVVSPAHIDAASAAGGFFTAQDLSRQSSSTSSNSSERFKRRTLVISDELRSDLPAHRVRHIQYDAWPDFDIPPTSDDVLELIDLANDVNAQMARENGLSFLPPILVHCSAGCGRTGCYMAIDVISDLLKQHAHDHSPDSDSDAMEVDIFSSESAELGQALLAKEAAHKSAPLHRNDPLFAVVNEMREQRMSMVANLAQYRFCHEAVLAAHLRNLA